MAILEVNGTSNTVIKEFLLNREQYYLDLLCPEYNILAYAANSMGYTHSEQTKLKMRQKIFSKERRKTIAELNLGKNYL